jgi:glycosyltransferase involved in cell wall biosynthesis
VRIALVGPTHPFKGGVAAHTTELAHRLDAAGHEVRLVSWSRLYPRLLYPGEQVVPGGGPDLPPYPDTVRPLRWDRPCTWWLTGRRLRTVDLVIVVSVVPAQAPAHVALIRALGRRRHRPRVVVLAHNVVPHETHIGGAWLTERVLRAADGVLVHSAALAREAREHGAHRVGWADLPPHLPGGPPPGPVGNPEGTPGELGPGVGPGPEREPGTEPESEPASVSEPASEAGAEVEAGERPLRVLALGMVRHYKGFDLLLEAAREVPGVRVTVAGEQWGRAGERLRELAADPALAGRVRLHAGYVPGEEVPGLLAAHDVLALPYRDATGSQNVLLGHAHRRPVLATTVGTFPDQVRDGVDGLLVPPGDVEALTGALRRLSAPGAVAALRAKIPPVDLDRPWTVYLDRLLAADTAGEPT